MKHKQKKQSSKPPIPLPEEITLSAVPTALGPMSRRRWSGKLMDKTTVSYSLTLPLLPIPESNLFLSQLRERYFRFLLAASQKKREEVWFGGLDWSLEGSHLVLTHSFSPFREKEWQVAAILKLSPEGAILGIQRKKLPEGSFYRSKFRFNTSLPRQE